MRKRKAGIVLSWSQAAAEKCYPAVLLIMAVFAPWMLWKSVRELSATEARKRRHSGLERKEII